MTSTSNTIGPKSIASHNITPNSIAPNSTASNRVAPKTMIEKVWAQHVIHQQSGHPAIFAIDRLFLHEVTSAQAFATLKARGLPVRYPSHVIATVDHSLSTENDREAKSTPEGRHQIQTLRHNAAEFGIPLYDIDSPYQGIVHVMGPELGLTWPGQTIVCGDSHTATHGAFGALAFGIGTSEVGHVLATGCLLQSPPKTMRIELNGTPQPDVTAKDIIMKIIATLGVSGAQQHIIEYTGEAIRRASMAERMTICNMSIECGGRAGLIAPDETTFAYLKDRPHAPQGEAWTQAVTHWRQLTSDPGCHYDKTITIDMNTIRPMVTWGINPAQAISIDDVVPTLDELPDTEQIIAQKAYDYTGIQPGQRIAGQAIQWAFIGSCTNGRIEDLRAAARILEGRRIHSTVTLYVVPGSRQVYQQAEAEGLADIFKAAGASFRQPGCSMCLAMNGDTVPPGARCISTSNRNFIGRQGPQSITHLASPTTVAASAIAGHITAGEV